MFYDLESRPRLLLGLEQDTRVPYEDSSTLDMSDTEPYLLLYASVGGLPRVNLGVTSGGTPQLLLNVPSERAEVEIKDENGNVVLRAP